jgi:putative GTP pyrophosphokinase
MIEVHSSMTLEIAKEVYDRMYSVYMDFCQFLSRELSQLIDNKKVKLAVPIHYRVKTWESIIEKYHRKGLRDLSLDQITDLAGLRVVVMFSSDIKPVLDSITESLVVTRIEDTSSRLRESQFGYGSVHLQVHLPDSWTDVPTNARFKGLSAEIQLRTMSQHTWAAASHFLQYKHEQDVPRELRRSMTRIAALLEIVDAEYERLLHKRQLYLQNARNEQEELNVETLRVLMDEYLPANNEDNVEDYSGLLDQVLFMGIHTVDDLKAVIKKHIDTVIEHDAEIARRIVNGDEPDLLDYLERAKRGVFYSKSGLLRKILELEFGSDKEMQYWDYFYAKYDPNESDDEQ